MKKSNNHDLNIVSSSVLEGMIKLDISSLFYNTHMRFCRNLYTLAFEALPDKRLAVLDGFTATGIRGLRYAKEGGKDFELVLLDINEKAIDIIRKNCSANNINADVVCDDFNRYCRTSGKRFDFVEIDPFGSALPFIDSGIYSIGKCGYLSVTATDTQVLCGANNMACNRYYGARSLNNYACHEIGLRILIATIARKASEQNKGITPLLSIAHRHYIKTLCKVQRGSQHSDSSRLQIGYILFCTACLFFSKFVIGDSLLCPNCNKRSIVLGPLWLGKLNSGYLLDKILSVVKDKCYISEKEKSELTISLSYYKNDDLSLLFYDIHEFCKANKLELKKNKDIVSTLVGNGFNAGITSFSSKGVKGNFRYNDFLELFKSKK